MHVYVITAIYRVAKNKQMSLLSLVVVQVTKLLQTKFTVQARCLFRFIS